ncbi:MULTISPECIES: ROK family transcriptional regulator [unclassified Arthrobacter]|uniref:ROK family transcriptional regulator n=1 Tax=unclassified Arthrobacter TaxID=235627 RepID=UPI0021589EF9|nr:MULTISPECIES: ROK family transcriptional regulator [unclassified Arthrobacter]
MDSNSSKPAGVRPAGAGLGNNRDSTRQHNLSTVLGLVHSSAGLSRAQLTRTTGLNRSTIAALVGELVQLGLVVESDLDQSQQHGRPSIMINPGPSVLALAVNPDVDAVGVALVALGGNIVNPVRFHTVRAPSMPEVVNIVSAVYAGMAAALPAHFRVVGIGVAVPGLVDPADGTVIEAPQLGWREQPLAAQLAKALQLPVACANDAVVGARAQAAFGAGREVADFVYLFGGASGIGGGIVSGGKLMHGATGFAGQLGHMLVRTDGAACSCGSSGCLEAEVTREELLRAVQLPVDRAEDLEQSVLGLFASGEASAQLREVLSRQARLLAVGLRGVVHQVNPSLIVLGGFLRILAEAMPDIVEGAVSLGAARGAREQVRIELAPLGESLILVGAAELAFAPLLADPAGVLRAASADREINR